MVSHKTARITGYIYAVICIILSSLRTVYYTYEIVHDENKVYSSLKLFWAAPWNIICILLVIGIIKYNLYLVKMYQFTLFIHSGLHLIYVITIFCNNHKGKQLTAAIWVELIAIYIISIGLLMLQLWIVNRIIRSIEHERSLCTQQTITSTLTPQFCP